MSQLYVYVTGGRSEGGLSWKDDQAACMATMAAKSRTIPIVFLVFCVVFAAAVDSDEVPASFDVLLHLQLQPEKAASLGYDCFTLCTAGCFAAGFPGDYCDIVCERECADEAQKH
jgi:hypothetical protein